MKSLKSQIKLSTKEKQKEEKKRKDKERKEKSDELTFVLKGVSSYFSCHCFLQPALFLRSYSIRLREWGLAKELGQYHVKRVGSGLNQPTHLT